MKGFEVSQALRAFPGRHATDLTRGGIGCQWAFCDEHQEKHTHTHTTPPPRWSHVRVEVACHSVTCRLSCVSVPDAFGSSASVL